jgi:hypothetical protein
VLTLPEKEKAGRENTKRQAQRGNGLTNGVLFSMGLYRSVKGFGELYQTFFFPAQYLSFKFPS